MNLRLSLANLHPALGRRNRSARATSLSHRHFNFVRHIFRVGSERNFFDRLTQTGRSSPCKETKT